MRYTREQFVRNGSLYLLTEVINTKYSLQDVRVLTVPIRSNFLVFFAAFSTSICVHICFRVAFSATVLMYRVSYTHPQARVQTHTYFCNLICALNVY